MPLNKVEKNAKNMWNWVTHTHTHIGGECPHMCIYCYVKCIRTRWDLQRYSGVLKLIPHELKENYGSGNIIFLEHLNDMFAKQVPDAFIKNILAHCKRYPNNIYVFQTKNPERYGDWLSELPKNCLLGSTIETNRPYGKEIGFAPSPYKRMLAMRKLKGFVKFISMEPIMDFDIDVMAKWIGMIKPKFMNIGLDSKRSRLPEPTSSKVFKLEKIIRKRGNHIADKTHERNPDN